MIRTDKIRHAAKIMERGGVIAYPTEGVFGLGCLPDNYEAVSRILDIKKRDASMGLVLIFSDPAQLEGWVDVPVGRLALPSSDEQPITWIVPATEAAPWWITGEHQGLAVRRTTHPVARALCDSANSAIVSTSANLHGRPPARNGFVLRRIFGPLVDFVVPGECGPASGPSEIRDLESGETLRH